MVAAVVGGKPAELVNPGTNSKFVEGRDGQALLVLGAGKERNSVGGAIVHHFDFDFSQPFSIVIVFKVNKDAEYRAFKDIVGVSDGERGPGFRVTYFYGKLCLRSGNGTQVESVETNPSKVSVTPDVWHHLAVTADGKTGRIYLDGIEVASGALSITPTSGRNIALGSFRFGYAYALQGALDDVMIFNRVKDAKEIAADYLEQFE